MKIAVVAVGRLGRSHEAALAQTYLERAGAVGRALGFTAVELIEVEARRPGRAAEAEALFARVGDAFLVACDEHGRARGSRDFAAWLAGLRDQGVRRLALVIGGADGLDPALLAAARETIAFGPQTWPHTLARVMLTEQIYRAITILNGAPYHRE